MSLVRAESRRLVKRRFTKLLVAGALALLAVVAVSIFLSNEKVTPAQVTAARAQAGRDYQESVASVTAEKQKCVTEGGTDCDTYYIPQPEDFDYTWYMPPTFDLRSQFGNMITTFAAILAAVAFLIGASFAGAEWSSGAMMNLLLWRPQRIRVLGSKLVVFLFWLTGLTLLLAALWTGAFRLIAETHGSTDGMTPGVWRSFGLTGLRGLAVVLVSGLLGFTLASIGRHTAMALGALIGLGALQVGAFVVATVAELQFPGVYMAPYWLWAWMYQDFTLKDYASCDYSASSGCEPAQFVMTWQTSGLMLAGVAVVATGVAMWTMRRRDIT
ncbi:ABC transporter permease [Actinoplanes sp. NPDC051851]|uniref:ABC transporter permease n=1 Tax=Actinoplanes sp. NPDC051851 TaxID=3154753 RepID=UPI00341EF9E7